MLRIFERIHDVVNWAGRLILIVRADIHVIVVNSVVGAYQRDALQSDCAIFSCASPDHAEQIRPAWHPIRLPERAVVQGDDEILPGEHLGERHIFRQADIFIRPGLIHIDVLSPETLFHMVNQRMHISGRSQLSGFHQIDESLQMRG